MGVKEDLYLSTVKGRAMIMMVCVLAYMAGWAALPRMMQSSGQTTIGCSAKMDKTPGHKCPTDGKCENGCPDCCVSCPLCYTMILPAFFPNDRPAVVEAPLYGKLTVAFFAPYAADVWRPPNVA